MLLALSGRTHEVLTAIAVCWNEEVNAEISTSSVTFADLARADIDRYVATGESLGKAGAYAVQGRAAAFVRRIDGSYSGVMGLPLYETASLLARIGFPPTSTFTGLVCICGKCRIATHELLSTCKSKLTSCVWSSAGMSFD